MDKKSIQVLKNHLNGAGKIIVRFEQGDRVHLKGTECNGIIVAKVFRDGKKHPEFKVKWDKQPELAKDIKELYVPYELAKEIKFNKENNNKKKTPKENFYLKLHGVATK